MLVISKRADAINITFGFMLGLLARFALEKLAVELLTAGKNKSCRAAETPVDHPRAKVETV
jgi:hypothetical protein